jgi:choline dehydrogenase
MIQPERDAFPRYADCVVVGGGTSGAVVAGRLAERSDRTVLLLEAGPDYGSFEAGAWPQPLLDPRTLPVFSHDWNYLSSARYGKSEMRLERARVLGGCSAHNGCIAMWGCRLDYDRWEHDGNPDWGAESLLPFFQRGTAQLCVRTPSPEEVTPWHQAILDAAPSVGLPRVEDLNDLDQDVGAGITPVNIFNGVRWNTAFAYVDPVRSRSTLSIWGNMLVDRLIVQKGRVTALDVIGPSGPARVQTGQVVLCAGVYGSPALLLRSGIGTPEELRTLGIAIVHALPGVGKNLHDHPAIEVTYSGTSELIDAMQAFAATGGWLYEEQTIGKARSALCSTAFDLHLYPIGGPAQNHDDPWHFVLPVASMTPLSRGSLRLASRDPQVPPLLDHGYLTDPDDHDVTVLLDGLDLVRTLASQPPLSKTIGKEMIPGPRLADRKELSTYIRSHGVHYYHPVGTCKMGPATDPLAVVDARGQLHGIEGVVVADASLMPIIPRANTTIPCVVIGEKIAALLLGVEAEQTNTWNLP